jgi:hypothetical protein
MRPWTFVALSWAVACGPKVETGEPPSTDPETGDPGTETEEPEETEEPGESEVPSWTECYGPDDPIVAQGVWGGACRYNFEHGDGLSMGMGVALYAPSGASLQAVPEADGTYGFETEAGGYILCDLEGGTCAPVVVPVGEVRCDVKFSDTPDEAPTTWEGCGSFPDWPVAAIGVYGRFAYDDASNMLGGASFGGEELRPEVEVTLYLDAWLTSGDDVDTCAITITLLEDVPATPRAWEDSGVNLDYIGVDTSMVAVEIDHTCGTEPWVADAVTMFGGYDWWVGFGDVGPDVPLSADEAESAAGGGVSWSRLEERGRVPTGWNVSYVYQLEASADGAVVSTDELGDPILLPSDQSGGPGWYEIVPYWLFWPSYLW